MSGPGTPFGSLSRNLSAENLASMNALTDTDISASALHSRLSSLRANRFSHHPPDHDSRPESRLSVPGEYFGHSAVSTPRTTPGSPILSRRPSDEIYEHVPSSGMATPAHPRSSQNEEEDLTRVPSYDTTMRMHVRLRDPGLPEYEEVFGPEHPMPEPPQSPQRAHVREGGRASDDNIPSLQVPRGPSIFQSHSTDNIGQLDDQNRNLRIFQARA